jgi:hypothetical protein
MIQKKLFSRELCGEVCKKDVEVNEAGHWSQVTIESCGKVLGASESQKKRTRSNEAKV